MTTINQRKASLRAAVFLFSLGIVATIFSLARSWHQPVLDQYGFRQTQTAISAYSIATGGPWLGYETPVLGAPWSVPFELPLYQWLVAGTSVLLPVTMDQAGRLVSLIFFLGMLVPLASILRHFGGDRRLILIVSGMLLLSPLYLFWSRAFMMESMALFMSVWFLSALLSYLRKPNVRGLAAMFLAAAFAATIKITTFVGFAVAGGVLVVYDMWCIRADFSFFKWVKRYAGPACCVAFALFVLVLWLRYSDDLKAQTLLGSVLTSDALSTWNFGTLRQRLGAELWRDVILSRGPREALGATGLVWLSLGAALSLGYRTLLPFLALIVLYLLPFLVFTNLHIVHHYYQYANSIFLVVAVAYVVWVLTSKAPALIGSMLIFLVCFSQLWGFHRYFYHDLAKDMSDMRALQLARFVREHTGDDQIILGFGLQWASDVPYYSLRKAMLVPDWNVDDPAHPTSAVKTLTTMLNDPNRYTGGAHIGAVIECPNALASNENTRAVYERLLTSSIQGRSSQVVADCTVYY